MAAFYCPCKNRNSIWAEFWWKPEEDKHTWVFFDDDTTSETYAEMVTHCPGCGKELHRRTLTAA